MITFSTSGECKPPLRPFQKIPLNPKTLSGRSKLRKGVDSVLLETSLHFRSNTKVIVGEDNDEGIIGNKFSKSVGKIEDENFKLTTIQY